MDTRIYLAFTPKFPPDIAVMRFKKKYGCEPERIFIEKGLLKLGPVNNSDKLRFNEVFDSSH